MALTDKGVEALKAKNGKPEEHFDHGKAGVKGLCIRVAPSGRKTWAFHFTFPELNAKGELVGKRARMDFGHYDDTPASTSLAEARQLARTYRAALAAKPPVHPVTLKRSAQAAPVNDVPTVADLVRDYIADLRRAAKPLRTIDQIERMLNSHVVKPTGTVRLPDVTRETISGVIDAVRDRDSHSMAVSLFSRLNTLFAWGDDKGKLKGADGKLLPNPVMGMKAPDRPKVRENARPLIELEIKTFWHGVEAVLPAAFRAPMTRILKLCLLSGCRLAEVVEMDGTDVRDGVWTIPPERTKNGLAHLVPVNEDMRAVIGDIKSGSPWGLVRGKPILARRVSAVFSETDVPKKLGAPDYTLHSLRRTVATQMDEMGFPLSTISLCLNHAEGDHREDDKRRKSVTRVYVKPSAAVLKARELAKLALKRDAFDRWAERLREIIS